MEIHKSYYETLYTRPVVTLPGYSAKYQLPGTLYAYLAFGGATGSSKDALAEGMLALAVEKGLLTQGQTVVEASSGSFGVALAIACAHSHHPLVLCMPATVPVERQELLAKFGAKIVLSNYVYGRRGVEKRAQEAAEQTGGYFLNYFDNDLNAEFHRRITGPAIVKATDGQIDAIIAGVGSGGTITGIGEYVKAWLPDVKIIAVEPYESQAISGGVVGKHSIPGLGAGFVPENYNPYIVDAVMAVPSGHANTAAREVLHTDAVPASPSCGAVLTAARQLMQEHPEMSRILCVFSGKTVYE
ncbi:MAG: pyridoxal-phosphate dependent enzyme [Ruthenibacterium sp.]